MENKITVRQALEYEISSSWWTGWTPWLEDFSVWYYTKKVKRRHKRYMKFKQRQLKLALTQN